MYKHQHHAQKAACSYFKNYKFAFSISVRRPRHLLRFQSDTSVEHFADSVFRLLHVCSSHRPIFKPFVRWLASMSPRLFLSLCVSPQRDPNNCRRAKQILGARNSSCSRTSIPALRITQPPIERVVGSFPQIKRPGHEADHVSPYSAEDSRIYYPPRVYMALTVITLHCLQKPDTREFYTS
jgi:hypothetical protein